MLRVIAVGVTRARVGVVYLVQQIMSMKSQHNTDEHDNCAYNDKSIVQAVWMCTIEMKSIRDKLSYVVYGGVE